MLYMQSGKPVQQDIQLKRELMENREESSHLISVTKEVRHVSICLQIPNLLSLQCKTLKKDCLFSHYSGARTFYQSDECIIDLALLQRLIQRS